MTKKIVAVDSQKLDSMMACTYQFKNKFLDGKEPEEKPDYYERGGLMHAMLDPYYKIKKYKPRWRQNQKTHMDIVQSCVNIGRHFARNLNIDIAEIEMCVAAFMQYTDFWENDSFNDILSVEQVGSKVLYENPQIMIMYEYKVDLIVKINNVVTPIDHKSAKSRRDPNYLSNQFRGYCWSLECNRILVNEIGFQKTLPPKDKFRRHTLTYSDNLIKEWREEAIYWIMHTVNLVEKGIFPRNTTSCDKFPLCPFKAEICSSDPDVREFKKDQFFRNKSWDIGADYL